MALQAQDQRQASQVSHLNSVSDPDPADSGQPVALQAQDRRQAPQVSQLNSVPDPDPADPGQPVALQAQDRRQAPQVSIKTVFRIRIGSGFNWKQRKN